MNNNEINNNPLNQQNISNQLNQNNVNQPNNINLPIGGNPIEAINVPNLNNLNKKQEPQKIEPPKNNVKIKRYKYKVKDSDGKIIDSYFDAENKVDVESFLLNKSYEILLIEEDKLTNKLGLLNSGSSGKMSSNELNFFLTQLSTYVKSGIPLLDSMEILSRQTKNKNMQTLYKAIVFDLNKGLTFSSCLEKRGKTFPKMLINMLKTSEMTGDLTGVLDDMAAYYKRQDSNRKQIINAMTYPSILLIFAMAVLTFVITYIVPTFTSMYDQAGAELPAITKAIINISDFVIGNWMYILLILIAIVIVLVLLYKSSKQVRYSMQSFVMHIPIVKEIIKYNQLVTFTGTFSTLIKHDVFITDSMDILSRVTDNEIYKKIINNAIDNLSRGNGVSVAFKGHWAFPETAYEMLVTGEKTGKLGEMMEHVSTYYQEEQTNIVTRLKSLIEPIMIVALALLVGVILLAVVVPMFNIYSKLI